MDIFRSMEREFLSTNIQQLQEKKCRRIEFRLPVVESRRIHHVRALQLRTLLDTNDRGKKKKKNSQKNIAFLARMKNVVDALDSGEFFLLTNCSFFLFYSISISYGIQKD